MKNVNSNNEDFCGKVPLNKTNMIQPHGYMLIISKNNFEILQLSENCSQLFGRSVEELAGSSASNHIPEEELKNIESRTIQLEDRRLPFNLTINGKEHLTTVKALESYYIFEVASANGSGSKTDSFLSVYQELKFVTETIDRASTTIEACDLVVRELKRLSGFDKIMIYKFDPEWNGDVIAEEMEPGMESYLGLKFPASDIPKQARELYKKTAYRIIPNVDYEPVKLYPIINPKTNTFTDLSDSNLRSVASVHIEYLRNMKVTASMSTRIMYNGELWGLIACHHRVAKYLSFEMCSIFELLSNTISSKISALQNQDDYKARTSLHKLHNSITEGMYKNDGLNKIDSDLLYLLNSDGVAIINNGLIETIGKTPSETEIDDLVMWLQSIESPKVFSKNSLSAEYEPAEDFAEVASGVLVLPIQPDKKTYILGFRPEAIEKVQWGGDPSQAVNFEADGKTYHPRASFELWQQSVTKTAIPWNQSEMEAAESLQSSIRDYLLSRA